jgi:glucosamine 6-phosphate synthetase-like amidotransferase/phosphosugar isomerase protein
MGVAVDNNSGSDGMSDNGMLTSHERRTRTILSHLYPLRREQRRKPALTLGTNVENGIERNNVCGIIAFVSGKEPAFNYLMEGLTILQNRGYDSAGICTLASGDNNGQRSSQLVISKYASRNTTSDALKLLEQSAKIHEKHTVGIAHTRWATHGGKTDRNAHPHTDQYNRIALVHNGVIENATELRNHLISKHGVAFQSETDTEVIVQLISVLYDQLLVKHRQVTKQGKDAGNNNNALVDEILIEALKQSLSQLEGTWGLVILTNLYSSDEPRLIAVRNGSPLLIGLAKDHMFVASESSAFSRHTREMIALENGEIAVITSTGIKHLIHMKKRGTHAAGKDQLSSRVQLSEDFEIKLTPAPYPHWTIKEIMEQPEAVSRSLNFGGRFASDCTVKLGGLDANQPMLANIRHLLIAACGTSYYASLYGAKLMRMLKCFQTVRVVDAAELDIDDFPPFLSHSHHLHHHHGVAAAAAAAAPHSLHHHCGLLVLSQSGETSDVMRCLNMAQELQIPTFSIVNKVGSLIARTTGCGVYINAGREHAVASTKAFSCQITVLSLVALWFAQQDENTNGNVVVAAASAAAAAATNTVVNGSSDLINNNVNGIILDNTIGSPDSNTRITSAVSSITNPMGNVGYHLSMKSSTPSTQQRQALVASLHRLPTSLGMLCNSRYMREQCAYIARNELINAKNMFLLGKGLGEPIALEGALKIKEITYTHAEAYSSGALKHGPFALIEEGIPIFIIILNDKYLNLNMTAAHEVHARGAHVYAITDVPEHSGLRNVCHHVIEIPNNGLLTALLAVVPLQLIAYELAVARGIDPDHPRHLAKSVTVL